MPPVIVFFCDELRADCLGCHGNPDVQTPNIDAFAADAVRFSNAFTTCPVCVPARSSFASGLYCSSHGAFDNALMMDCPQDTWYNKLRELGYDTYNYGKLHVNWHATEEGRRKVGLDEVKGFRDTAGATGYLEPEHYSQVSEYKRLRGYVPLLIYGEQPGDPEDTEVAQVVRASAERMESLRGKQDDFLFITSTEWPHTPYIAPREYYRMYDHRDIEPFYFDTPLRSRPRHQQCYCLDSGCDLLDEEDFLKCQASYYARVTATDHYFGRWVEYLKESGLYDEAIIIFLADHGTCLGEHGFAHKVSYMFEQNVHVPMMVRFPGGEFSGLERDELVQIIDIYPTVMEALGHAEMVPDHVQGENLLPLIEHGEGGRDHVFAEWFEGAATPEPARMVRNHTHQLNLYPDAEFMRTHFGSHSFSKGSDIWATPAPEGELYDLRSDPRQMHNLFDDPDAADVKQELLDRLEVWKEDTVMFDYSSVLEDAPRNWTILRIREGKNLSRLDLTVQDTPRRVREL